MLKDRLTKEPSKADVQRKADAWKVLNEVLVKTNSEFMTKLSSMLAEKQAQHKQIQEKIEKGEGTEDDRQSRDRQASLGSYRPRL